MITIYLMLSIYCLACWGLAFILLMTNYHKGYSKWFHWLMLPVAPIYIPVWIVKQLMIGH